MVVTVGVWAHGNVSQKRFVPTVVVEPPGNLQQRLVDVGGGAAFLHRADAIRHGFAVAKLFVDAQERVQARMAANQATA
jgi:hypothetical protein